MITLASGSSVVIESPTVDLTIESPVVEIVVEQPAQHDVVLVPLRGPRGPGGGAAADVQHVQSIAAATWTIAHDLGRLPSVAVYLDHELVEADVHVTSTSVTVTFPAPVTGVAVLT